MPDLLSEIVRSEDPMVRLHELDEDTFHHCFESLESSELTITELRQLRRLIASHIRSYHKALSELQAQFRPSCYQAAIEAVGETLDDRSD
jgi:hypothetical protein